MKKILSIVTSFMLVVMLTFTSTSVFAQENGRLSESEDKTCGLFVISNQVDNSLLQYAYIEKQNVSFALEDVLQDELDRQCTISYGTAFNLNEIAYIPVLINNEIVALLAITETDGEYGWTLSKDFSNGLNSIASFTSAEVPAVLYTSSGNVYADISGNITQLTFNPEIEEDIDSNLIQNLSGKLGVVVNLYSISEQDIAVDSEMLESRAATSKTLDLDLAETQSDQSWCSAFAGAQILRYIGKGSIYAEDIMKYFYPKESANALKEKSISNSQLIEYANEKGSKPTRVSKTLSLDSVKKQIDSGKPVYLGCEGRDTYKKARHALVLRGYDTKNSTYSVWNPWNAQYVSMSTSSKSISVSGGKFVWDVTIYQW